jgi:hypothetical protein
MKRTTAVCLAVAAVMLAALPAFASADGPTYTPAPPPKGPDYHPAHPGPSPHGNAYGVHCKGFSKKHVKGEKGTPFSRCVKAMARADKNDKLKPKKACKGLSKKHVKGQKGTPFSRCVKAVAKMRRGVRYESPAMELGPNGWAGWSCPTGKTVIGGGYEPATATVQFSGAAEPGAAMYPVYPHYTFTTGETGWVVQNDNDQETIKVFVICR